MKRSWLAGLLVPLVLVPIAPAGAEHSWGGYHWPRSQNPFALDLVDSMTASWDVYLGPVSVDWTASSVLDTPVVAGDASNNTRKKCPSPDGKVRVCNAAYGFNGWLGIAEIWISGGHIVKARARVNDSYFSLSTYDDPNAKRHVLCQEVGHVLGLDHQTAESCMDDRNGLFSEKYVSPNAHDYEQLVAIYGSHLDSGSSGSKPGKGNGNGKGNGRNVTVRADGGYTLITWVFPAR